MPILPGPIDLGSVTAETIQLLLDTFNQGIYMLMGVILALTFAVTWKG